MYASSLPNNAKDVGFYFEITVSVSFQNDDCFAFVQGQWTHTIYEEFVFGMYQ